jgi:hypothetical protein
MEHEGFGLGLFDKTGREILCGDTILHLNESENTKREYWYPIYKIVWDAPCFVARHIGGGKPSSVAFSLKYYSVDFFILGR